MKRKRKKRTKKNTNNFRKDFIKKSILRIAVLLLIIGLNWAGLSAIGRTLAYFNDIEESGSNSYQVAILDFSVTNNYIENFIGMEALSEIEFASIVTKTTGSLAVQYEVNVEKISGNDDFCQALKMEVEHNGVEKHDGSLLSFSAPSTTQLGTWEFEIDLPSSAANVPHGVECNVDLVFKGWRSDVVNFEDSGFTDEERIELRLTSRMIVLNEFLPNPSGLVPNYGFDFGEDNDSKPKGEWVELYNNSDTGYDLAGWYIWDDSGDEANKIEITAANTIPPATVIGAQDWLVVYMNKEVFDNNGDTVKLFNQNDEFVDSYTYTDSDYCEIEPTPGDENTTDTTGTCGGVPPNKSYARIPDGIGYWVDPIPTPGRRNILDMNQEEEDEEVLEETPVPDENPLNEPEDEENDEEQDVVPDDIFDDENIGGETIDPPEIDPVETDTPEEEGLVIQDQNQDQEEIDEEPVLEPGEESTDGENSIPTENQDGGIIDKIDELIDGVVDAIVEEILPEEPVSDEVIDEEVLNEEVSIEETPVIDETVVVEEVVVEEAPIVEETVIEEPPATEEQPVIAPEETTPEQPPTPESGGDDGNGDEGSSGDGSGEAEATDAPISE